MKFVFSFYQVFHLSQRNNKCLIFVHMSSVPMQEPCCAQIKEQPAHDKQMNLQQKIEINVVML